MMQLEVANGAPLTDLTVGQLGALEDLYDRYSTLAYSLAFRMLGDSGSAEDVVQESFLALWRSATVFDGTRGSESSWLVRIVRHRCIDHLRRQMSRPQSSGSGLLLDMPSTVDVPADVFRNVTADEVRAAIVQLPAEQIDVVELAYFSDYSHSEIAERLGLPLGTVKGRMRLALRRLRETLGSSPSDRL